MFDDFERECFGDEDGCDSGDEGDDTEDDGDGSSSFPVIDVNEDLLLRKARGVQALLGSAVSGVARSGAGVVGGGANFAVSALSSVGVVDEAYARCRAERRERQARQRDTESKDSAGAGDLEKFGDSAAGVAKGFLGGISDVGRGVFDGVAGVVQAPIDGAVKGALEDGAAGGLFGALGGVAKGVTGLFVKPVVGVADGVNTALSAVQHEVQDDPLSMHAQRRQRRMFLPQHWKM